MAKKKKKQTLFEKAMLKFAETIGTGAATREAPRNIRKSRMRIDEAVDRAVGKKKKRK